MYYETSWWKIGRKIRKALNSFSPKCRSCSGKTYLNKIITNNLIEEDESLSYYIFKCRACKSRIELSTAQYYQQ